MEPHDESRPTNDATVFASERYKAAFTIAMMLFLVTLTMAILVLILASAREEDRESQFETTLTAVYSEIQQTGTANVDPTATPPAVPAPVSGQYPITLDAESPVFSGREPCTAQHVSGQVRDADGMLTDAFSVQIWGDFFDTRTLQTGELGGFDTGEWELALDGMRNRRVFVQIMGADRYLSAPVEIIFTAEDCDANRARLYFFQTGPLN